MDVCLVNMPWAFLTMPLLSVSLLKATLRERNISCQVDYANLYFAAKCGLENYYFVQHYYQSHLLGEFIFADAMGMPRVKPSTEYMAWIEENQESFLQADYKQLRTIVPEMQKLAAMSVVTTGERILAAHPKIVGMASMFQQNNAAIALLRYLKSHDPDLITIMGGANCVQEAGRALLEHVPELDFAFSGEADECFAEFCQDLLTSGLQIPNEKIPFGVMSRKDNGSIPCRISEDMNRLPIPDYDDYLATLSKTGLDGKITPVLMIEGSRGCWWAERKPCSFCGLNGQVHRYRQKDAAKIVQEIAVQSNRYGIRRFAFSDSNMSPRHVEELPRLLQELPEEYTFFTEIKSNITESQLKNLNQAGFKYLQPGIESLHDGALELMNKGNRAIRHIELLKNLRKYRNNAVWNFLYGFPGENTAWYREMLDLLPKISHFPPPNAFIHIQYHRNSEYYLHADKYQLTLRPARVYSYVWPKAEGFSERIGYLFEALPANVHQHLGHSPLQDQLFSQLNCEVEKWKKSFRKSPDRLDLHVYEDRIEIVDLRSKSAQYLHTFAGLAGEIYLMCDQVATEEKILAAFQGKAGSDEVLQVLRDFCQLDLMLKIGTEYLAIAIQDSPEKYGVTS